MTDSLPEWVPDEYDPDAPLAERLPVIAEMGSDAEIHVQDKRGVHYVVNQPQDLGTLPNDGLRLDCGTRIDYWSYEIVAPANTSPSCERSIRIRTTKRTSRLGRRSAVILTCACTASTWTGSRTTRRRPRHEHHSLAAAVRAPHASRRPRRDRRLLPVARLLAYLADTVTLRFTEDGLRVETVSDTNVIGLDATIPVEYDTDTEPVTFAVKTEQFLDSTTFINNPESIKFQIRTDDPEVSVSAGSYLNYVDALEPTDPETIAPPPT